MERVLKRRSLLMGTEDLHLQHTMAAAQTLAACDFATLLSA